MAVALAAVIALHPAVASAHAELRETTPAEGERLVESPPVISLRFTESVELLDDAVVLLDSTGVLIDLGPVSAEGLVVTAEVPDLAEGGYVVDWNVVSTDGHPVTGAFTFTVGDAALPDTTSLDLAGGAGPSSRSGALIVWRALTYAGFALVLGVWAFVLACWTDGRRDRGILVLSIGGATVALIASTLRTLTESSALGASLSETFDLRSGRAWFALIALAVLANGVGPMIRSRVGQRMLAAVWMLAAVALGVAVAYAGHGATGRIAVAGIVLTTIHVAAVSIWIGGLAALWRCAMTTDAPNAWRSADRFSNVAFAAVLALAATGTFQAVRQLDEVDAITGSNYGRALLVKLAVIAGLLLFARLSRRILRRALAGSPDVPAPSRLRRSVTAELSIAVAVFAATGWLAGASPNTPVEAGGPVTVSATDPANTATATATITPAAAGPNYVHLTIDSPDGEPPDEVQMQLAPVDGRIAPIDVTAHIAPDHAMSDRVDIPFPGAWTLTIKARYGDFSLLTFDMPLTIR